MVTVIFTCYNRLEKTKNCIQSLIAGNPSVAFSFVILDDNSSDGTRDLLLEYKADGIHIELLKGDGNSFWAGGMRLAIACAKKKKPTQYYLLVNDDVDFASGSIEKLLEEYKANRAEKTGLALVGATCDENGDFTYGGVRYDKGIHYQEVTPGDTNRICDSFNMNCLLLDQKTFFETPNFDERYIHSLADFDYGLGMKRQGTTIMVAPFFVGICKKNSTKDTWMDRSLSRKVRIQKKDSPKGAPFGPWMHFLYKNFGLGQALLHGFTPYIRILLGK